MKLRKKKQKMNENKVVGTNQILKLLVQRWQEL